MSCITLCPPDNGWLLAPLMHVRAHLVGTENRRFPGLSFTVKATRRPVWYVVHHALPMTLFSFLSLLKNMSCAS